MRQITEVLRLQYEVGLGHGCIARACGLSKRVVGKYVSTSTGPGRYLATTEGSGRGSALRAAVPGQGATVTLRRARLLPGLSR